LRAHSHILRCYALHPHAVSPAYRLVGATGVAWIFTPTFDVLREILLPDMSQCIGIAIHQACHMVVATSNAELFWLPQALPDSTTRLMCDLKLQVEDEGMPLTSRVECVQVGHHFGSINSIVSTTRGDRNVLISVACDNKLLMYDTATHRIVKASAICEAPMRTAPPDRTWGVKFARENTSAGFHAANSTPYPARYRGWAMALSPTEAAVRHLICSTQDGTRTHTHTHTRTHTHTHTSIHLRAALALPCPFRTIGIRTTPRDRA
jgi:hypothetical protein